MTRFKIFMWLRYIETCSEAVRPPVTFIIAMVVREWSHSSKRSDWPI